MSPPSGTIIIGLPRDNFSDKAVSHALDMYMCSHHAALTSHWSDELTKPILFISALSDARNI